MDFAEKSYQAHQQLKQENLDSEIALYRDWFNNGTVDLWRHMRYLSVLNRFLETDKQASWLTVGDGRFGTSARYIEDRGSKALATDINTSLLEIARQKNMLNDFRFANAEALPFEKDSFDYAYCKLAYHHFPRPQIALFEMLRVAKKAVILTEPADWIPGKPMLNFLKNSKNILRRISGKKIPHTDEGNYETAGNYIFTLSEREIEKNAMAINLPAVAFKRFHDIYFPGVEQEKANENGPLFRKIKNQLFIAGLKEKAGLMRFNNIQCVIFKTQPEPEIISLLKKDKYDIRLLPANPHL